MTLHRELKREAYEANLEIPKQALALYTFGNVSAFDAVSYTHLTLPTSDLV